LRRILDPKMFNHFDWPLFLCTALIVGLGLLNLYSATFDLPVAHRFKGQLIWTFFGVVIAFFALFFDYRHLQRLAYPIYVIILIALVLVLIKGRIALGAQRWLQLGPLSIQPSELAKVAVAFCLARYFHARRSGSQMNFLDLIVPGLLTVIPFILILRQPDLGTGLIVVSVAGALILFAGVQRRVLITIALAGLVMAPIAWKFVLRPYQQDRVRTFINPEKYALGKGYQIIQSKIAIGSGELTGKGYLKGTQSKLQFLPKQYTDFVFSNFAEEWGFVGSVILLSLFALFSFLGLNVAYSAKEPFGMMLAFGLTALILSQAAINLGMEMGLLPVVGVTLPLFSYGGTSLVTTLFTVGILLNISMRRYMF